MVKKLLVVAFAIPVVAGLIKLSPLFFRPAAGSPYYEVNQNPGILPPPEVRVGGELPGSAKSRSENTELYIALDALKKPLGKDQMFKLPDDFMATEMPEWSTLGGDEYGEKIRVDDSGNLIFLLDNADGYWVHLDKLDRHNEEKSCDQHFGSCPRLVWIKSDGKYKLILDELANRVAVEQTSSNGLPDLVFCTGSDPDRQIRVYRFDGEKYQQASVFFERSVSGQFMEFGTGK